MHRGVRTKPVNLYDLTREELRLQLVRWDLNPFHVAQLWNCLYLQLAESFDAMPELPARVRTRLKAEARLCVLPTALETDSSDGFTRNYTGRRVSRSGRFFLIENATVWTLKDEKGGVFGTGAFFRSVTFLSNC